MRERIQYRPDLNNCAEVAVFCGFAKSAAEYGECDEQDHEHASWGINGGDEWADPGEWIERDGDGRLHIALQCATCGALQGDNSVLTPTGDLYCDDDESGEPTCFSRYQDTDTTESHGNVGQ